MFSFLHIENIAIMDNVDVEFFSNLNVLTGETGAGKSILIDSVNLLTGERSSKDLVRSGCEKAVVEGVLWADDKVREILFDNGIETDENDPLVIRREITKDGRSVARINGRVVTTTVLKEICARLVNIHGQHDNQYILNSASHQKFLDDFADCAKELKEYKKCYAEVTEISDKLTELQEKNELKEQKRDILAYQTDEIKKAQLYDGEEEELNSKRKRFLNSEAIVTSVSKCHGMLFGDEEQSGALDLLDGALSFLQSLKNYEPRAEKIYEALNDIRYEIEDISESVRDIKNSAEYEEIDINEVEQRLDLISRLKRKYGNSISEILETYQKLEQELFDIENSGYTTEKLQKELKEKQMVLKNTADVLTKKRILSAKKLEELVMSELEDLEMARTKFSVLMTPCDFFPGGQERVEFLIAPNKGEDLKPLTKIASGGELSRIILALKVILSESDQVETLIFDEVDSGVSGKAAQKIGEKLKKLSKNKQVFVITHLAQVAAFADNHFKIEKSVKDDKTFSTVSKLNDQERISELARIMSGEKITNSALMAASELIEMAKQC